MQRSDDRLRVIRQILVGQFLAMFGVAAAGWLIGGELAALSALLGGFIAWLPNMYFALRAFRYRGARAAHKIVRSFYAGAFGKMILTMALFAIVFIKIKPLSALALFVGFIAVQTINWVVPLGVAIAERDRYKVGK